MNKVLTKTEPTVKGINQGNVMNSKLGQAGIYEITGDATNIVGDIVGIRGDVSNIRGKVTHITGDVTKLRGDISKLHGCVTGLSGDCTKIAGCATGLFGNLDDAGIDPNATAVSITSLII